MAKFLCVGEGHPIMEHPWIEGVVRCRECHKWFFQAVVFDWRDDA